jgi:hypothetical protein
LAERLRAQHLAVVRLHEPTNGPWGQKIRTAARTGLRPPAEEEADWFTRDRQEDVRLNIAPALAAGAAVFSAPYSPRRFNCRLSKHPELKDLVFGHETPGPYNEATRKEWSNWYRAFNPEGWKAYVALREEQGMARARQRDEGAPCGK